MLAEELRENLQELKQEIKETAERVGRDAKEIKIIAVSKNQSSSSIDILKEQGLKVFGENRVQELLEKNESLEGIEWHFIGHLQRNKVKYLLRMDNCKMIQSVDSYRLAKEINKRAKKNKRIMPVLVEVNIAEDENKFGLKADSACQFVQEIQKLENIKVEGLMTIAPYKEAEEVRPYFKKLAKLKEEINNKGFSLKELSMGMSNDFVVAIEEGATMIRVGTTLFGKRNYN